MKEDNFYTWKASKSLLISALDHTRQNTAYVRKVTLLRAPYTIEPWMTMTSFPPIHSTPGSFLESSTHPQQSPTTPTNSLYKGSAIPVQAWTVPEGSRRLRLPEFHDNRHMKVRSRQPSAPTAFTPPPHPQEISWYSFPLEAESTPEPQCCRKDEKFQWHNRESNQRYYG